MYIEPGARTAAERSKVLSALVVPRPIALVTSMDRGGRINAAPFSYFNLMGSDPAIVVLGVGDRPGGEPKDTAANIRQTGHYVVHVVDEALLERMNIAAIEFPPDVSEVDVAGFTLAPSTAGPVPRIAEAPAALECREVSTVSVGRTRVILGEVVGIHLRDDLIDPDTLYVATERLQAVGRMHGGGWYARTTDLFMMPRITYAEWLTRNATRTETETP